MSDSIPGMKLHELYACRVQALTFINSKGYRTSREVARWDAAIEARIVAIGATPPGQGE